MILDERDIALGIEHRTRQLRAEKRLQMLPSEQEQSWSEWCNLLTGEVDAGSSALRPTAPDLTPCEPMIRAWSPSRPRSTKYLQAIL